MVERKSKEETAAEMDAAAAEAEADLDNMDPAAVKAMSDWLAKWYLKAGYKRLGRILVTRSKKKAGLEE